MDLFFILGLLVFALILASIAAYIIALATAVKNKQWGWFAIILIITPLVGVFIPIIYFLGGVKYPPRCKVCKNIVDLKKEKCSTCGHELDK